MGAKIYMFKYKPHKRGKLKTETISKKKTQTIINIIPQLTVKKKQLGVDHLEIEGLKVYKNSKGVPYIYINFYQKDIPITSSIGVYKFNLSQTITQEQLEELREQQRKEAEQQAQEEQAQQEQEQTTEQQTDTPQNDVTDTAQDTTTDTVTDTQNEPSDTASIDYNQG